MFAVVYPLTFGPHSVVLHVPIIRKRCLGRLEHESVMLSLEMRHSYTVVVSSDFSMLRKMIKLIFLYSGVVVND